MRLSSTYVVTTAGSVDIGVRDTGTPGARALVALHGLGASGEAWEPLADRYAGAFRVVAPDLRGHGASTWNGSYGLPDMAADVSDLLHRLELHDVTLVGHSMGASIALMLAVRDGDRVERLVLEEPPPPSPAVPPRTEGSRPDRELRYDWAIQEQFSRQRNDPDPRWWSQLAEIRCPVTIIRGTGSHIGRASVQRMAAAIPDARLVEVSGGHDLHTESGDHFYRVLDDLLVGARRRGADA